MGYVDCDTHIWETDATWSHLAASEQMYKPAVWSSADRFGHPKKLFIGPTWQMIHGDSPIGDGSHYDEEMEFYPRGTRTLEDVAARLAFMDRTGVDVQVLHPTGWGIVRVSDPREEIALTRSYNRWMAEATAPANGRMRWQIQPSMGTPEAVIAELEWGKAHGAVGIHLQGIMHNKFLTDPSFYPVWEKAEELGLVCLVHVGASGQAMPKPNSPTGIIWNVASPVVGAFFQHLASDLHVRFPALKWIYVEAGSMWAPWIYQQYTRAGADLWRDLGSDWRTGSREILAERNAWIVAEQDDDLSYVINYMGDDYLSLGSDYGHFDMGTDPFVHRQVMENTSISVESREKITSSNARRLFGIDPSFTPADQAAVAV